MRVLIAEQDPKLRYAITILAHEQPGWLVAGSVGSFAELLRTLESIHIDMLIADSDLPGFNINNLEKVLGINIGKIIILIPAPVPQMQTKNYQKTNCVWISKMEYPERLVEIFRKFGNFN